jgi:hypothetical protein
MATHAFQLSLYGYEQDGHTAAHNVAVQVTRKDGLLWHVHIRPMLVMVNHFDVPLYVLHHANDGPSTLLIPAGHKLDMHLRQGRNTLRIWLGESWSGELELSSTGQACQVSSYLSCVNASLPGALDDAACVCRCCCSCRLGLALATKRLHLWCTAMPLHILTACWRASET